MTKRIAVIVASYLIASLFAARGVAQEVANPFAREYTCELIKEFHHPPEAITSVVASQQGDRFLTAVQRWVRAWGRVAIGSLLLVLGIALLADSIGLALGRPLLPQIKV